MNEILKNISKNQAMGCYNKYSYEIVSEVVKSVCNFCQFLIQKTFIHPCFVKKEKYVS